MTDPTDEELDAALKQLVADELLALGFEAMREMKRIREEMGEVS